MRELCKGLNLDLSLWQARIIYVFINVFTIICLILVPVGTALDIVYWVLFGFLLISWIFYTVLTLREPGYIGMQSII